MWMRRLPSELVLHVLLLLFVVVVVPVGGGGAAAVVVVVVKELVLMTDRYPCRPRWWQQVLAEMLVPGCFHHCR